MDYINKLSKKNIADWSSNDLKFLCDLSLSKGEKKLPEQLRDKYYIYVVKAQEMLLAYNLFLLMGLNNINGNTGDKIEIYKKDMKQWLKNKI